MTPLYQPQSRWLLVLITLISALSVMLSSVLTAHANNNPNPDATWAAWGLAVDFPNQQLLVRFATYVGDDTPQVLDSTPLQDITSDCSIPQGALTYDGAYAIFDGTTYIACNLPDWQAQVRELAPHLNAANLAMCECPPQQSPFWVSADVVLAPVASANPLFDGSEVGFTFSLPSNGTDARTRVERSSGAFVSPPWTVDSTAKRVLVGQYGQSVNAIADYFGGLQYLTDPLWRDYFKTQVKGNQMGQWFESPSQGWRTTMPPGDYTLNTGSATVYIGHNDASGAILHGKFSKLRVDPGCRGS